MEVPSSPLSSSRQFKEETWRNTVMLSFQSLGVVYGRLGTAPLYVFGAISLDDVATKELVYETFSFMFWTLTIIPLFKYTLIVMKADDDGEGGPFSLYSLLCRHAKVGLAPNDSTANEIMDYEAKKTDEINGESRAKRAIENHKSSHYVMLVLALYGSCIIIVDGVLTPAISVLSASTSLEGSLTSLSNVLFPEKSRFDIQRALKKFLPVPAACAIVCLFNLQHFGTQRIGFLFAPVVSIWLIFITFVGIFNIFQWDTKIIFATDPRYMIKFMRNITFSSWKLLGSIVLCIAGTEAMYTDIGHFSKKSITLTFICLVYPALVLSYAGQAAFLSKHFDTQLDSYFTTSSFLPTYAESMQGQGWLSHIFVVLSLFSSVVGSQGTITATFTIINQCQSLGCFPRVKVKHTSDKIHGRVYISDFNWILMILSIGVTIGFNDVSSIANATGFAIMSGMLVTTCLMSLVIALYWEKSLFVSLCFLVFFGSIETMYASSCLLNFHKGPWFLIILLLFLMIVMLSWHYGTVQKYKYELANKVSTKWLTDLSPSLGVSKVPGIGFVYTDIISGIPSFFSHFISVLPAFHQILIFVSFKSLPVSYIQAKRRFLIGRVGPKEYKIYRCIVRYGYRDMVKDADDFEDHIIHAIGEFISKEEDDFENLALPEVKMIVVGCPEQGDDSVNLIPDDQIFATYNLTPSSVECTSERKNRLVLVPPRSSKLISSVTEELQKLVDARESGTAYFSRQSHLTVQDGASFWKRFLVRVYVLLDKNCQETPIVLNIPQAAVLEFCMVYIV